MKSMASTVIGVAAVLFVCGGAVGQNVRVDPPGWETPTGEYDPYDPAPFDFGEVAVGETASVTFQILSMGPTPLYITSVYLKENPDGAFAIAHADEITPELLAGEWLNVVVDYTPTALGEQTATLRVTSNDREEPILDGPLTGTGVPEPATAGVLLLGMTILIGRQRR